MTKAATLASTVSDGGILETGGGDIVTENGIQTLSNKTLDTPSVSGPTISGQAKFANGTPSAPSITCTGDLNTGIFFPAADTVAISTDNFETARFESYKFSISNDLFAGTNGIIPSATKFGAAIITDGTRGTIYTSCYSIASIANHIFYNPNGIVGSITTSGSSTAYNVSSDVRLKTNIFPADDAGSLLDAINVVQFDWKTGGHSRYGVIAQELNTVVPEAVSEGADEMERPWGVDYSKLVPLLVKEIQSLRARVAALEAAA